MKKVMLLAAMLAMVLMVASPMVMAQTIDTGGVTNTADVAVDNAQTGVSQTGTATATSGDASAAAGNQSSTQTQTATNVADVEQNVTQTQEANVDQWGSAAAKGHGAKSGDVEQGAQITYGDQSVSATVDQANYQDQTNEQISRDNTATATSEANAELEQEQEDIWVEQDAEIDAELDQEGEVDTDVDIDEGGLLDGELGLIQLILALLFGGPNSGMVR